MSISSRITQLLERAQRRDATAHDAREAVELLRTCDDELAVYDLLFVIGRAQAVEYRELVQRYLHSPGHPMHARIALQILCDWWSLGQEYRGHMIRFVVGVEWDLADGGYVQLAALSSAGELIAEHEDPALMRSILEVYDDPEANDVARAAAYGALWRALGRDRRKLVGLHRTDWTTRVDSTVVATARRTVAAAPAASDVSDRKDS